MFVLPGGDRDRTGGAAGGRGDGSTLDRLGGTGASPGVDGVLGVDLLLSRAGFFLGV